MSAESEILWVVGEEIHQYTAVLSDIRGVCEIEMIEGDGILADRRRERILQQAHLIIIDIDIGEHILHGGVQDITRLEEVIDTVGGLSLYDTLLIMRVFTVELLRDGLIHTDRKDQFVVILTHLHLIDEPLMFLKHATLQVIGLDVVKTQGDLLVVVILVEIVILQVGPFLGGDHLTHELHGRVVLTAVLRGFLRTHIHLIDLLGIGLQTDLQGVGRGTCHIDKL